MMRIGVISDTHGSLQAFDQAMDYLNDVDLLIHAGDVLYHGARNPLPEGHNPKELAQRIEKLSVPLMMVKGNVDAEVDDWVLPYPLPPYALVQDGQRRIVAYHGFQHKSREEMIEFAGRFGAKILIYGHIHQPVLEKVGDLILVNPGSVALPKQEPKEPTFAFVGESVIQIRRLCDGVVLQEIEI